MIRPMIRPMIRTMIADMINRKLGLPTPLLDMPLEDSLILMRGTGPATFTRASDATLVDKDTGLVRRADQNLLLRSEEFDNAVWSKLLGAAVTPNQAEAPDGTMTADKITFSTTTNSRVEQNVSGLVAGATYTLTCYARVASGTSTRRFGTSDVVAGEFVDVIVTSVWQRFSITIEASGTSEFPRWSNSPDSSAGDIFVWGAQLEQRSTALTYNKTTSSVFYGPRFETNGILIEGASTNIALHSEDGSDAVWQKMDTATVTPNTAIAPDGTMTADTVDLTGSTTARVFQQFTPLGATDHTFSLWLKALPGDSGLYPVSYRDNGDGSGSSKAPLLVSLSDTTWTQVQMTATGSASQTEFIYLGNRRDVTGETLNRAYVWGGQMEDLPFASSYIPTTTTSVTRASDNLSVPAANIPAPAEDYSVSAEVDVLGLTSSNQSIFVTQGETFRELLITSSGSGTARAFHGGAFEFIATPSFSVTSQTKLAASVANNVTNLYLGGALTPSSPSAVATPITGVKSDIKIGNELGSGFLYGHVKNFKIFDVALTADEVAQL